MLYFEISVIFVRIFLIFGLPPIWHYFYVLDMTKGGMKTFSLSFSAYQISVV